MFQAALLAVELARYQTLSPGASQEEKKLAMENQGQFASRKEELKGVTRTRH